MNHLDWKVRIVIAGGRNFNDYDFLKKTLDRQTHNFKTDPLIISGTAQGADRLGERYAKERGWECLQMPARWELHGKRAGYMRNEEMACRGTHCVCFWDGKTPGTKHMIAIWVAQHGDRLLRIVRY